MRKVNKTAVRITSILLTLVLASACMVSGTFARYKTGDSLYVKSAGFEQLGVTVELEVDSTLETDYGATVSTPEERNDIKTEAGIYTVNIQNLALKPGDDIKDVIKFSISGSANIKCKVNVDMDVSYTVSDFSLPASVLSGMAGSELSAEDYHYMPIKFWLSMDEYNSGEQICLNPTDIIDNNIGIEGAIYQTDTQSSFPAGISGQLAGTMADGSIEKEFDPNATGGSEVYFDYYDTHVKHFNWGFSWELRDNTYINQAENYITRAENTPLINIAYTITVEQIQ